MRYALAQNKRLGLFGWIKAKIMTARMRWRWNHDAEFRERVKKAVNAGVLEQVEKMHKNH